MLGLLPAACCLLPAPACAGITGHWPAHERWSDEYLLQQVGDVEVTVALTPNGRADAVTPLPGMGGGASGGSGDSAEQQQQQAQQQGEGEVARECFALPAQRRMPFRDFLSLFYSTKGMAAKAAACSRSSRGIDGGGSGVAGTEAAGQGPEVLAGGPAAAAEAAEVAGSICSGSAEGASSPLQQRQEQQQHQQQQGQQGQQQGAAVVPYLQFQNSSLLEELPRLLGDVDEHFGFATEAFGGLPEA